MSGSRTFPSLPIVSLPTRPRTGAEAKRMAEQLNRAAKRRRAERDDAHKIRQRQISEEARRMRETGKSAGGKAATASVPPRPRSFMEIARNVYGGAPDAAGDGLIGTSVRGGTR